MCIFFYIGPHERLVLRWNHFISLGQWNGSLIDSLPFSCFDRTDNSMKKKACISRRRLISLLMLTLFYSHTKYICVCIYTYILSVSPRHEDDRHEPILYCWPQRTTSLYHCSFSLDNAYTILFFASIQIEKIFLFSFLLFISLLVTTHSSFLFSSSILIICSHPPSTYIQRTM